MSRLPLRKEKNCLNCGHFVKERFCPNCGQENAINRPSFHYLFTHFAGDLVHYDSGFWKTCAHCFSNPDESSEIIWTENEKPICHRSNSISS